MPREYVLRRPGFHPGHAIRMADGQEWTLPGPGCPGISGAEYESLLAGLSEAEDEPERLRAELALAIYLLDRNYRLTPEDFTSLLGCPADDDRLARLQAGFRAAAAAHASHGRADLPPNRAARSRGPEPGGPSSILPSVERCFLRVAPESGIEARGA